jgi:hypothetical protein
LPIYLKLFASGSATLCNGVTLDERECNSGFGNCQREDALAAGKTLGKPVL